MTSDSRGRTNGFTCFLYVFFESSVKIMSFIWYRNPYIKTVAKSRTFFFSLSELLLPTKCIFFTFVSMSKIFLMCYPFFSQIHSILILLYCSCSLFIQSSDFRWFSKTTVICIFIQTSTFFPL